MINVPTEILNSQAMLFQKKFFKTVDEKSHSETVIQVAEHE